MIPKKEMLYMAKLMGMCQRADTKSRNPGLPKDQRDFHAGRTEGYLKALAEFMEVEVAEIRTTVLGTKARMRIENSPTDFPLSHWLRNGF